MQFALCYVKDKKCYSLLYHAKIGKHAAIGSRFLFQLHRIGATAAGHSVETETSAEFFHKNLTILPHRRELRAELPTQYLGRFLPRSRHSNAVWQLLQQRYDIGFFDHLQVFVGSRATKPTHGRCRVEQGNTFLRKEIRKQLLLKTLLFFIDKIKGVAMENTSKDAPHVVLHVWIEELHGPALCRGRKTAKHQQSGIWWQKGL